MVRAANEFGRKSMISLREAEDVALQYINKLSADVPGGVSLIPGSTIKKPYGWVFFFNSKRFIETGNMLEALGGNSPIVVESSSEKLTLLGTALPVEESLRRFEAKLPGR